MPRASNVAVTWNDTTMHLTVEGHPPISIDVASLPESVQMDHARYGTEVRIRSAFTGAFKKGAEAVDLAYDRVTRLIEAWTSGARGLRRGRGGVTAAETTLLAAALARTQGITVEEAMAKLTKLKPLPEDSQETLKAKRASLKTLRSHPVMAAHIEAIKAERQAARAEAARIRAAELGTAPDLI